VASSETFDKILNQQSFDFYGEKVTCHPFRDGLELIPKAPFLNGPKVYLLDLDPKTTESCLEKAFIGKLKPI
jgi:hypothetical protein